MILALLTKLGLPQWAAELLGGAAIVLVLCGGSAWVGYSYRADADQAAQEKAELVHAQQLAALQAKGEALQSKFDSARAQTVVEYRDVIKEVPRVTTVYRSAPGAAAQPLPACVFTRGFVSVWNRALDPGVPAAAAGAAAPAADTNAADDLDSGATRGDVLRNHVDNAASCTAVRQQLNALIDWHEMAAGQ